jgi:hypothetical protein
LLGIAALCSAAVVAPTTGPSGAQTTAEPAEVISRTPANTPWTNDNRTSSISANGQIAEFDSRPSANQVSVRDRVGNTTVAVPTQPSVNGSISDNGCVIAYTYAVPFVFGSGSAYAVFAYDRCVGVDMAVGTAIVRTGFGAPSPKPNQDGSRIVWSNGLGIQYATRSGNSYAYDPEAAIPPPPGIAWLGPNVAVSDAGNLVAFETDLPIVFIRAAQVPSAAASSVYLVDLNAPTTFEAIAVNDAGTPISAAFDPSISGDGRLVSYRLQPFGAGPTVIVRDRTNRVNRPIAAQSDSAEISRDGRYVAYLLRAGEVGDVYVARSTSRQPFATFERDLVSYVDGDPAKPSDGSASNPAISDHGRWVSFDSFAGELLVPGTGFDSGNHVFVRQRRPVLTVGSIDFGAVPSPALGVSTVRNTGLSGWVVTSIAASSPFSVDSEDCPNVIQPGQSCSVTVRYTPSGTTTQTGQLVVRDDTYPGVPLAASGRLSGSYDPDEPPPAVPGLSITPNPILFDETVVGVSAPDLTATVSNTGETSVSISSVALSGSAAGDYSIEDDGCTSRSLSPDATCEVVVGFVPTDAGGRSATLTVSGSGGTSASAGIRGTGLFDATLSVLPEVAPGGQVVQITGEGYPPAEPIGLTIGTTTVNVTTEANGEFLLMWLVLSGTPQGAVPVDDVAATGRYDAEPVEFQVVGSPMRPQGTATLVRNARNYVSR